MGSRRRALGGAAAHAVPVEGGVRGVDPLRPRGARVASSASWTALRVAARIVPEGAAVAAALATPTEEQR